MKKAILYLVLVTCVVALYGVADAATPVVSDVVATPQGEGASTVVNITYDVTDSDSDSTIITIAVSNDSGKTFTVQPQTLIGDVWKVDVPGDAVHSKSVEWAAGQDVPGVLWENCQVKVTAQEVPGAMVLILGGTFDMGQADVANANPIHQVTLSAYYIDVNEVTVAQYVAFLNSGGKDTHYISDMSDPFCEITKIGEGNYSVASGKGNFPIVYVNWEDAKAYCEWAGKRLPTEAEWEYAARGMDGWTYPWGEGIDNTKANYDSNVGTTTTPVGTYPTGASPFGCLDMAGNVWEWVSDWRAAYSSTPQINPTGPETGGDRVMRGGSWLADNLSCRAAWRSSYDPSVRNFTLGFRCAQTP